ncbi:hypothetical protein D3C81_907290 [compost metagenome]
MQQLRQVEFVGAGREVSDHVMATVALEPLEGIAPRPPGQGVIAQATNQQVIAAPAAEDVVAKTAIDRVVSVVAGQGIVEVRADEVFDTGQGVSAGTESVLPTRQAEADRHPSRGVGVTGRVDTRAAIKDVIALAAEEQIIAGATMQLVVAGTGSEHIVAVAGIDDVVARARHQYVIPTGTGEGMAVLIADGQVGRVAAAVVVVGGVGAVVVRGDFVCSGVVDGHGQFVVFCPILIAATGIGDVGHVDLVSAIGACGDGVTIGDAYERPTVERILHRDVPVIQVVIEVECLTLIQLDRDEVFIVAIGVVRCAKITTDHQQRRHGRRVGRKGVAHVGQILVAGVVVFAGEADRAGAGEVRAFHDPAGVERGRCRRKLVAIGVGVVGQQQFARHHDGAREHVGDDVVVHRHRRRVGDHFHGQRRAGEVAIVVAGGEADVLGDHHRSGFLRGVVVIASVEVDHQRAAVVGGDAHRVVHGVEGAVVGAAA